MRKDNKKALYESIMTSVAKEVKKVLNEKYNEDDDLLYTFQDQMGMDEGTKAFNKFVEFLSTIGAEYRNDDFCKARSKAFNIIEMEDPTNYKEFIEAFMFN